MRLSARIQEEESTSYPEHWVFGVRHALANALSMSGKKGAQGPRRPPDRVAVTPLAAFPLPPVIRDCVAMGQG